MKPEDLIKTRNTNAMEWAKAFKYTVLSNQLNYEEILDEGYMVGWFANAIMTMSDLKDEEILRLETEITELEWEINNRDY